MLPFVRRVLATTFAWCAVLAWISAILAEDSASIKANDHADSIFGLTRVCKIHLHVTADHWKAMQPAKGGFPGFGPPRPGALQGNRAGSADVTQSGTAPKSNAPPPLTPTPSPDAPRPAFRPGSFGYEFDYVKADIEFDGQAVGGVGLRFKGNGTYMMSAGNRKRPFKIDFNRYVNGQKFHGLQQLNLHNNVMDPTYVRQALSYRVFEAAGIPAPRTAFAEVSLTIDGECDHEPLGLYTLVEEIDKAFLRNHFQSDQGLLLKPEGTQGLEHKGEDWAGYAWFEPKSKVKKEDGQRLIDLTRLIAKADDEQFRREIGTLLDTDQFARFLAANTLLANMDSFLTHVHNYYVYLPPKTGKFVFLPWDMDLSLGAFFMAGSAEQLQDLSISHPHVGEDKLIERLLAWNEFDQIYRDHLRQLTEKCFGEQGMTTTSLPVLRNALKELISEETKRVAASAAARSPAGTGPGGFGPGGFGNGGFGPGRGAGPADPNLFAGQPALETFLVKRRESITAQLAGKSKGKAPGMNFGPPGGGGGFGPGNFLGPQILGAADGDKDQKLSRKEFLDLSTKWLKDWDKDASGSLDEEEFKSGVNASLSPQPNANPAGFQRPPGFGPGMFLGPQLLKAADLDKDGKASAAEWSALFETWFKEWDKGHDEFLSNQELVAGLNAVLLRRPPGMGPPGFGQPRVPEVKPDASRPN